MYLCQLAIKDRGQILGWKALKWELWVSQKIQVSEDAVRWEGSHLPGCCSSRPSVRTSRGRWRYVQTCYKYSRGRPEVSNFHLTWLNLQYLAVLFTKKNYWPRWNCPFSKMSYEPKMFNIRSLYKDQPHIYWRYSPGG